jgi:hypothetical protein
LLFLRADKKSDRSSILKEKEIRRDMHEIQVWCQSIFISLFDDMPANLSLITLCLLIATSALKDGGSFQLSSEISETGPSWWYLVETRVRYRSNDNFSIFCNSTKRHQCLIRNP